MEESSIIEYDGRWLHELALNNTVLEGLNFYMTDLVKVESSDLELLAKQCPSLNSVKISDCDVSELVKFLRTASSLEEFGGGSFSEPPRQVGEGDHSNMQMERYGNVVFPQRLCRLGLTYLGQDELPVILPISARLRKLDLLYALLDTKSHCMLLQGCPNLEILEVCPFSISYQISFYSCYSISLHNCFVDFEIEFLCRLEMLSGTEDWKFLVSTVRK